MIVFDLQCSSRHIFEGWFSGEDDFSSQCRRGVLRCPMCGDAEVNKRLSAPRLHLGVHTDRNDTASMSPAVLQDDIEKSFQKGWLEAARRIFASTEDVGDQFSLEARRIHYGEVSERGIRGYATPAETVALIDEGIAVLPFLMPDSAKKTLQ